MPRLALLILALVALAAAPAAAHEPDVGSPVPDFYVEAQAEGGEPPTATVGACTPQITLERASQALRLAVRAKLPRHAGRAIVAELTPCTPARIVLEIKHGTTLLARAERTLRTTRTAHLRMKTTKAIERLAGKRLRLRLLVRVEP